jgi:tetratricopeptide (TPR) repeat protein
LTDKAIRGPSPLVFSPGGLSFSPKAPVVLVGDGRAFSEGMAALREDRLDDAVSNLEQAVSANPAHFDALYQLSVALFRLGRLEDAAQTARAAVKLNPRHPDALVHHGLCQRGLGNLQEAAGAFESAIRFAPTLLVAYEFLGATLLAAGKLAPAENVLRVALGKGRRSLDLYLMLAELSFKRNDTLESIYCARQALLQDSESSAAHTRLGLALTWKGDREEGEEHLRRARELDPDNPSILSTIASAMQFAGRFAEARQAFEETIALEPKHPTAYLGLFNNGPVTEEMSPMLKQAEGLLAEGALSPQDASVMHFAIGKAYDNLGEYERAMGQFDQAHRIMGQLMSQMPFNRERYHIAIDDVMRVCTPELMERAGRIGNPSDQPLFIMGMIRSGTTLTEQIISCHPLVGGAGEQGFFHEGPVRSNALRGFTPSVLPPLAASYLSKLRELAPGYDRITDKMPANYLSAGFIHLAFPNAKIIWVRRNPCDTCLSIWTTHNRAPLNWAHRKEDIVFVYREYQRLLNHWRKVIPAGQMLEVEYEQLVENREATVRGMLDFCGLDWSDSCLHHEANPRVISTPSVWQARQAIYQTSLRRRDNYRGHLGAFQDLLAKSDR